MFPFPKYRQINFLSSIHVYNFLCSGLAEEDCITMGHMADQTEKKSMKCEQGELFMDIVDSDRCLHLQAGIWA